MGLSKRGPSGWVIGHIQSGRPYSGEQNDADGSSFAEARPE